MSRAELVADRDWARSMEVADHRPDCQTTRRVWVDHKLPLGVERIHPDPMCPGCVTHRQRAQWRAIADELDAFLGEHTSWGPRSAVLDERLEASS